MKEDFVTYELAVKLRKKGFNIDTDFCYNQDGGIVRVGTCPAPQIHEVLKWLRDEKNIDIEIHAVVGPLGCKVYIPYISTYTEFALEASPEIVRYRQKKFNTTTPLKHEIIPAHKYFEEWEEAALDAIKYVLDNIIKEE